MNIRLGASLCLVFALAMAARADDAPFRIGAASVVITPKVSPDAPAVWLAGFKPGRQAEGVHDDIYARAIAIYDGKYGLAIVACDLVGLFYDEVVRIRGEIQNLHLSPPIEYVLVSSTHTHAGPDTIGLWGTLTGSGLTPGYLDRVRAACVEAVRQAHAAAMPANLRIATVDPNGFAELIGDSRLPRVIVSRVTIVQALSSSGAGIATLVNVPCHPEVLGSGNHQLSGDFPSTMRESLEARFGGLAVYNSGAIGGLLAPRKPAADPFTNEPLPADDLGKMMTYGRIMGRIAGDALTQAEPLVGPIRVRSRQVLCPIWNDVYRLSLTLGKIRRQAFDAAGQRVVASAATSTAPDDAGDRVARELYLKTEVALVEIGPLQIAAFPGELYPELALGVFQRPQDPAADYPNAPLEPAVLPLMHAKHKMIISLANDELGYIIPKSQWDWQAPFAYGRRERQYGEFNSCGPQTAPRLMEAWASLLREEP